jgi:hypothetical protein
VVFEWQDKHLIGKPVENEDVSTLRIIKVVEVGLD